MLSNNVGGSVVIDGKIYSGDHLHSGEIGHLSIVPDGNTCYCGKRGCVDTYCAATVLSSLTDGDLSIFFSRLKTGDTEATRRWDSYLNYSAITLSSLYMLFDCQIVLGGYVGEYISEYMDDLSTRIAKCNIFGDNQSCLSVCRYKREAIAAGAALNFISNFIKNI